MKAVFGAAITSIALAISGDALAQDKEAEGNLGISPVIGTLGLGLELDYDINNYFSARLQASQFQYDDDFEEDGINYSGEVDLSTFGLLIDYHPFSSSFRLTGGFYSNGNELNAIATDSGTASYEIGDAVYQSVPTDPLTLDTDVELGDSSAGYLGLGWGHSPANDGGWMMSFEMGVMFSGAPTVNYEASGSASINVNGVSQQFSLANTNDPLVQEFFTELDKEADNLEDDLSDFEVYPVIKLGVGYRF